jgi:hypothetical protein
MSINILGYYILDILHVHEVHALENQPVVISLDMIMASLT